MPTASLVASRLFLVDRWDHDRHTSVWFTQGKWPVCKGPFPPDLRMGILGLGHPAPVPDSHPFSLPPLQPAPRPVACEQRRGRAGRPASGHARGPGGAVLPRGRRAPRAPRAPGLGRRRVRVPAVRRRARGHRRPRQPVRRLGPGAPHGLVDTRVAAFHVTPRGLPGCGRTVASVAPLGTRGGLTPPLSRERRGTRGAAAQATPRAPSPRRPPWGSSTCRRWSHVRQRRGRPRSPRFQGPGTPRSFLRSS